MVVRRPGAASGSGQPVRGNQSSGGAGGAGGGNPAQPVRNPSGGGSGGGGGGGQGGGGGNDKPKQTAALKRRNRQTFRQLQGYLEQFGLGSLFEVKDGRPSGWLWKQITQGNIKNQGDLQRLVESTDVFKEKYGVVLKLRKQAQTDPTIQQLSVAQVQQYRLTTTQLFKNAGLPQWMWDSEKDFDKLMLNGLSADEVQARIENAYSLVAQQGPEVRQAFSQFFGVGVGDAALAAAILDPEKGRNAIERQARMAYAAGSAEKAGVKLTSSLADRIASTQMTAAGIGQTMSELGQVAGLAEEGIGERTDIDAEDLVESVAFGDTNATRKLEQRLATRRANDSAAVGGAVQTQAGFTGLAST